MKITWFGGRTTRLHTGGKIVVTDPDAAPDTISRAELVSAADIEVALADPHLPALDPGAWQPPRARRLIDEAPRETLDILRVGPASALVASSGEAAVVVTDAADLVDWGRWADDAVIVVCGSGAECAAQCRAALAVARPRFLALALADGDADSAFDSLRPLIGRTGLVILEPGLAIEA